MNNSWTLHQTKQLFDICFCYHKNGKGLNSAFKQIALTQNRSVNSVRNFYYAQCKTLKMLPLLADEIGIKTVDAKRQEFECFTQSQKRELIELVLVNRALNKSVRAILNEYSNNNATLALRYLNKYRSMLNTHKTLVQDVMASLTSRNIKFFNPYTNNVETAPDNHAKLAAYLSNLNTQEVSQFMDIISKLK